MAPTVVQRVGKGANAASVTIGSGDGWSAPTAGNYIIVSANSDATVSTPTGAGSWTAGPSVVDGNGTYTWYKVATGTETSITFSPSVSDKIAVTAHEVSGLSAFDVSNSSTIAAVSGNATTSTSVTTTQAGDYVIAFALLHGTLGGTIAVPTSPTWTNSFVNQLTASTAGTADADCFTFVGELTVGAAGSYSTSCSWTNNRADRQEIVLAFKASAGGSTLNGDASVTATATVSPTAAVDRPAQASVTATASITATAAVTRNASASLTATATVSPTAAILGQQNIDASATTTATVSPTAAVDRPTQTSLTTTAALATTAAVDRAASSSGPTVTATVGASASVARSGDVAVVASASITATVAVTRNASASLTLTANLVTASDDAERNATSTATVTAGRTSTVTVTAAATSSSSVSDG